MNDVMAPWTPIATETVPAKGDWYRLAPALNALKAECTALIVTLPGALVGFSEDKSTAPSGSHKGIVMLRLGSREAIERCWIFRVTADVTYCTGPTLTGVEIARIAP